MSSLRGRVAAAARRRGLRPIPPVRMPGHDVDGVESAPGFGGWLLSFPRSGNTWMRELIGRTLLTDAGLDPAHGLTTVVPDIYEAPRAERPDRYAVLPLVVKTHAARLTTGRPVVSLHRSPADALVSFWRYADTRRIKGRSGDPDAFALANLPAWVETATTELRRVRSGRSATIILYPDLCDATRHELRRALRRWGVSVSTSAIDAAVRAAPPANLEHGYSEAVLARPVLRRIDRATRALWRELVRARTTGES